MSDNLPEFYRDIFQAFNGTLAHAFLVTGLEDYVQVVKRDGDAVGVPMRTTDYIEWRLSENDGFDLVIRYNRVAGFTFLDPAHRELFTNLVGLTEANGGGFDGGQDDDSALDEYVFNPNAKAAFTLIKEALYMADYEGYEGQRVALIIDQGEPLFGSKIDDTPQTPNDRLLIETITTWANLPYWKENPDRRPLIIVRADEPEDICKTVRTSLFQVNHPMPDRNRLVWFTNLVIDSFRREVPSLTIDTDTDRLAMLASGLTLTALYEILFTCFEDDTIAEADFARLKDKYMAMRYGDRLKSINPSDITPDMVIGTEKIAPLIQYYIELLIKGDARIPAGLLFIGPPGTGKTLMAKAIASVAGIPLFEIDLSALKDKWVGETGKNARAIFNALKANSPCVAFFDEIDQDAQRGGAGDGGTTSDIFREVLKFLNDGAADNGVLSIAASNKPSLLDGALIRGGRLGFIVPFFPPTEPQQFYNLLTVNAKMQGLSLDPSINLDFVTTNRESFEVFTGADIGQLLRLVWADVSMITGDPDSPINAGDIVNVLQYLNFNTQDRQEMIAECLEYVTDLRYLPDKYRDMKRAGSRKRVKADTPKRRL